MTKVHIMTNVFISRFVIEILKTSWLAQDEAVVTAFRGFLANLVTAHRYYIKHVMFMLVNHFQGRRKKGLSGEDLDKVSCDLH